MLTRHFPMRFVAIVVFFATLWLILWRQLSVEWSVNDQYSYGWFVPFFAIVLFWLRFEDSNSTAGGRELFANRPREAERWEDAPSAEIRNLAAGVTILSLLLLLPIRLF